MKEQYGDISLTILDGYVALCEIQRGPNNFFDHQMIKDLASCFEDIDESPKTRAIVLCSEGKHFCAGANFTSGTPSGAPSGTRTEDQEERSADKPNPLYTEAVRLFRCKTPIVAAVQGAAIGGGFAVGAYLITLFFDKRLDKAFELLTKQ